MRIYVVNGKKARRLFFAFLILLAGIVLVVSILPMSAQSVFSAETEKDLPIYSVDYPDKKVAITFDCAWVAVP